MGKCLAKKYEFNNAVLEYDKTCWGGGGEPKCRYLSKCVKENGLINFKRRRKYLEKTDMAGQRED